MFEIPHYDLALKMLVSQVKGAYSSPTLLCQR
jgi:hypothetical protein